MKSLSILAQNEENDRKCWSLIEGRDKPKKCCYLIRG